MTTTPFINLNGTSAKEFLEENLLAINALRIAISTLAMAAPNARDYQTAPMGTFRQAESEHRSRLMRLETVMQELEILAEHISDEC